MFGRRKRYITALVAEFLGAGVLTLLILSVQRSTIGVPFFVAGAAALTITLMTFAAYAVSGAHFNPALTLGLWTARKVTTIRAITYIAAQFAGAALASLLYVYLVKNQLKDIPSKFDWHILVAEGVGTALLAFGYAAVYFQRATLGVVAAGAGLAYMVGSIAASPASLGLINPAVALGVHVFIWKLYLLGPVIGAVVGVNLYGLLFAESAVATAEVVDTVVTKKTVVAAKPSRVNGKAKAVAAKKTVAAKRTLRKK